MEIDDNHWRPITFQGITFPPTLMAISVLEAIVTMNDDLGEWLFRFPICCGCVQRASAECCEKFAGQTVDLLLQHRMRVIEGIRENLVERGFDPETTFRDWILGMQRIQALSKLTHGERTWSAPSHPRDKSPAEMRAAFEQFFDAQNQRGST